MRKIWIKRAIIGSILIAIIVAGLGFAGYKWAKQYYYDELENRINNLYLEGGDAIGFYAFSPEISTELYSNEYEYKNFSTIELLQKSDWDSSNVRQWPHLISLWGQDYDFITIPETSPVYTELADSKKFAWWITVNPLNKFVVFKKTRRGFDFIDEHIMGIGFKFLPPCTTQNTGNLFVGNKTKKYIYTDFFLCGEYINYLTEDKYGDVNMKRNAIAYDKLVEDLRRNLYRANHGGNLYYGNNFYELRPDKNYLDGGNIYVDYNTYGNAYQTLYGATVTVKYSIQAKETVLEDTFLKRTSIAGICLILTYIIFCAIMNNKKVKS